MKKHSYAPDITLVGKLYSMNDVARVAKYLRKNDFKFPTRFVGPVWGKQI